MDTNSDHFTLLALRVHGKIPGHTRMRVGMYSFLSALADDLYMSLFLSLGVAAGSAEIGGC